MVEIIDSIPDHVFDLRSSLRDGDKRELAVAGVTPAKAVWRCFRHSLYRKTALVDGRVAAMWGVGGSILGTGEVWLLTSGLIEKIPFTFIREGRREVTRMLELFPSLMGAVHCEYKSAVRFVKMMGFNLVPGDPFCLFTLEN